MRPAETAVRYDQLARWWQENVPATYGLSALERALRFAPKEGSALDVGCGSEGRFLNKLKEHGFQPEGMDVSSGMLEIARERYPELVFHEADISTWTFPKHYDFISAWDSTFHLPLDLQEPVLRKMCDGLAAGGVLLFTCGGGDAGEIKGSFQGQEFGYSTLGVEAFIRILDDARCFCRHVEYDQHPEKHVVIIAEKEGDSPASERK